MNDESNAVPRSGATAADVATWAAVEAVTERSRDQLSLLLGQDDVLTGMARRFANVGAAQRAGHVFEWQQELTFNLDAIARGSSARAVVTEWLGEPHAAADLRLVGPDGAVLSEVQAKVVASVSARVGSTDGLSASRYSGMQLLTPSDHAEEANNLLGRRLGMPAGPLHERYDDVRERLTDRIKLGGVESQPVSAAELNAIADDPRSFVSDRVLADEMAQVGQAAIGGAALAGVVAAATTLAASALRNGSLQDLPWAEAGRRAASGAARGAAVALMAQGVSLVGQLDIAGNLSGALIEGALPGGIARGVFDIAVVAHGVATGRLSRHDAALEVANVVTRSAMVWTCMAIGQAVVPVPVVGALVGGAVGQLGATMLQQGIQFAVVGRARERSWDDAYDELLLATAAIELTAERERDQLKVVAEAYRTAFAAYVVPRLDRLAGETQNLEFDVVLDDLVSLTRAYAGRPLFVSLQEFDDFMADASLSLDLRMRT